MTEAAQQALRRLMELYSSTTRFAFACNTSSKIIEPLQVRTHACLISQIECSHAVQSRCAILRFGRLSDKHILKRLMEICEAEKVTTTEDGLEALVFIAEGDMRQAINNLQSTYVLS